MTMLAATELLNAVKFTAEVWNVVKLIAVKVRTNSVTIGVTASALALTGGVILGSYQGLFAFMGETDVLLSAAKPFKFTAQIISAPSGQTATEQIEIKGEPE